MVAKPIGVFVISLLSIVQHVKAKDGNFWDELLNRINGVGTVPVRAS